VNGVWYPRKNDVQQFLGVMLPLLPTVTFGRHGVRVSFVLNSFLCLGSSRIALGELPDVAETIISIVSGKEGRERVVGVFGRDQDRV